MKDFKKFQWLKVEKSFLWCLTKSFKKVAPQMNVYACEKFLKLIYEIYPYACTKENFNQLGLDKISNIVNE